MNPKLMYLFYFYTEAEELILDPKCSIIEYRGRYIIREEELHNWGMPLYNYWSLEDWLEHNK
jgi:hypothetical protein